MYTFEFTSKELKLLRRAMIHYTNQQHSLCSVISLKDFKGQDGKVPTKEDIKSVFKKAEFMDSVVGKLMEYDLS